MDARKGHDVFVDGQIAVEREALGHVADARGGLTRLVKWIGAKIMRSAIGREQPQTARMAVVLPGAVRADARTFRPRSPRTTPRQGGRGAELPGFDGDRGRHGLNSLQTQIDFHRHARASGHPCCCRRRP